MDLDKEMSNIIRYVYKYNKIFIIAKFLLDIFLIGFFIFLSIRYTLTYTYVVDNLLFLKLFLSVIVIFSIILDGILCKNIKKEKYLFYYKIIEFYTLILCFCILVFEKVWNYFMFVMMMPISIAFIDNTYRDFYDVSESLFNIILYVDIFMWVYSFIVIPISFYKFIKYI